MQRVAAGKIREKTEKREKMQIILRRLSGFLPKGPVFLQKQLPLKASSVSCCHCVG